jgi:hypothetical protein
MTPDEAGHPTTATTVEPTKEEVSIKMDYSGSDRKVPATKKRPSRSAKKRVVYFVKSDSELESDEDGDDASKKRSFKKIANTEPDRLRIWDIIARCIAPFGSATAIAMAPRSLRPR